MLTEVDARAALASFDLWCLDVARFMERSPNELAMATRFMRRVDLSLRTVDAIHMAMA